MQALGILVWILVGLVAVAVIARLRSLLHPTAFPPWATPLLDTGLRHRLHGGPETVERSGLAAGMRALEVGPGNGVVTEAAVERLGPAGRLVCLDLQPAMLHQVRTRLGARCPALVCASGAALPFRVGSFDHVFLCTVLGEIPDKRGAMREYARVLRRDGVLAVSEALPDPDYVRTPVLRRLAHEAGFVAGERIGNWAAYTHRFVRPAGDTAG